jgi:inner membrane protein
VIATLWSTPTQDLLAHRGFTHSLLFLLLTVPLFAWVLHSWYRKRPLAYSTWIGFIGVEMLVHLLLDSFNNYGTGLLIPFSNNRFSFNAMFVADPLFTILPLALSIALLFMKADRMRKRWAYTTIGWCVFYLLVCLVNKAVVERAVARAAEQQHITYRRHFTTPTPLNNLLWYVVLEDDRGYHIGYRSVFDRQPQMELTYFNRNDSLLTPVKDLEELKDLFRFSQGYYTVERLDSSLVFNDLRFGQIAGWYQPRAGFVFHYYLQRPFSNDMVVQRGRFANWNKAVMRSMWMRIKGN